MTPGAEGNMRFYVQPHEPTYSLLRNHAKPLVEILFTLIIVTGLHRHTFSPILLILLILSNRFFYRIDELSRCVRP